MGIDLKANKETWFSMYRTKERDKIVNLPRFKKLRNLQFVNEWLRQPRVSETSQKENTLSCSDKKCRFSHLTD